jgi:hypothetical protein
MPRWSVDYIGRGAKHLGTVEASNASDAVAEAAKAPQERGFSSEGISI